MALKDSENAEFTIVLFLLPIKDSIPQNKDAHNCLSVPLFMIFLYRFYWAIILER
jgi:hypothetical protein